MHSDIARSGGLEKYITVLEEQRRKREFGAARRLLHLQYLAVTFGVIWLLLTISSWVASSSSHSVPPPWSRVDPPTEPSLLLDELPEDATEFAFSGEAVAAQSMSTVSVITSLSGCIAFGAVAAAMFFRLRAKATQIPPVRVPIRPSASVKSEDRSSAVASPAMRATTFLSPPASSAAAASTTMSAQQRSSHGGRSSINTNNSTGRSFMSDPRSSTIKSPNDLDRFLAQTATEMDTDAHSLGVRTVMGTFGITPSLHISFAANQNSHAQDAATSVESEGFAILGIRDIDLQTRRVKEWIVGVLQEVNDDIARCNRWMLDKQLTAFDCFNSLGDTYTVTVPGAALGGGTAAAATTTGWGGAFGTTTTTTTVGFGSSGWGSAQLTGAAGVASTTAPILKKIDCLENEKAKLALQANRPETHELMQMLDLRIRLESILCVDRTFPRARESLRHSSQRGVGGVIGSEASRHHGYVIRRLKSLCEGTPALASYRHNGGDPQSWTGEFPADPYIILHVIANHFPVLERVIRLAHQPVAEREALIIHAGSYGEPYFYVTYRHPPTVKEKIFHVKHGADSFFHALIVFFAIVEVFHGGAYGGVFGVIDLEQMGYARQQQQQRRSAAPGGSGGSRGVAAHLPGTMTRATF